MAHKLPLLCLLGTSCSQLPVRITQILASYPCRGLADLHLVLTHTTPDLFEHHHYLVYSCFLKTQTTLLESLSSNLAFFCLLVSRSLSPRDGSWLHILQINISLLGARVSQNSLGKSLQGRASPLPLTHSVEAVEHSIKGASFQPPHCNNRQKLKPFLKVRK